MNADYYVLKIRSIQCKDIELLKEQCEQRIEYLKTKLNTVMYSKYQRYMRELDNINRLKGNL